MHMPEVAGFRKRKEGTLVPNQIDRGTGGEKSSELSRVY
jgi:hypothetical protein